MADYYVIATRREWRGKGTTAAEAVAAIPGVTVTGGSNPDRVLVQGPASLLERLKKELGDTFLVERETRRTTF